MIRSFHSSTRSVIHHWHCRNGAGKTTAINCLVGTVEPTSGDCYMGGMHVVYEREKLRKSLGVCPQFDTVYVGLAVG